MVPLTVNITMTVRSFHRLALLVAYVAQNVSEKEYRAALKAMGEEEREDVFIDVLLFQEADALRRVFSYS